MIRSTQRYEKITKFFYLCSMKLSSAQKSTIGLLVLMILIMGGIQYYRYTQRPTNAPTYETEADVRDVLSQMALSMDAKCPEENQGIFTMGYTLEDKAYTITYMVPATSREDYEGIENILKDDFAQNMADAFGTRRTLLEQMQKYGYCFASRYTNEDAVELLLLEVQPEDILERMK